MARGERDRSGRAVRGRRFAVWTLVVLAVAVAGAGLYATRGLPGRAAPAWLTAGPIAHRGEWSPGPERPENSLVAFEAAVAAGLAIELDVHLTSDNVVVVVHDADLERVTGEPGLVTDLPAAEVTGRRLLGGDQRVPTLAEVLALVQGRVPVLIEMKDQPVVGPLEEAVAAQLAAYGGPIAVQSFNPFSLQRVAEVAPDVVRGQLTGDFADEDLAWYEVFLLRNLLLNWASRPDFVAVQLDLQPSVTATVQRWWGRPVLCWTAQDTADAAAAAAHCDGTIGNPGSRAGG